jgi:hypothetical protein
MPKGRIKFFLLPEKISTIFRHQRFVLLILGMLFVLAVRLARSKFIFKTRQLKRKKFHQAKRI